MSDAPPHILVTNDDGWEAPGVRSLASALAAVGVVTTVAPAIEQSGAGHSLTLTRPLRFERMAERTFRVDGTPTDCVHLALYLLDGDERPDIVVSGINRGLNVGDDVTYSGTVAGALEGTLLHLPSVAVSAERPESGEPDYDRAARYAVGLVEEVLRRGLPENTLLNVNVPHRPARGWKITRQGTRHYRAAMVPRTDPSGREYYWIAPPDTTPADDPEADHLAVADGFVSLTPLHANLTDERFAEPLAAWDVVKAPA